MSPRYQSTASVSGFDAKSCIHMTFTCHANLTALTLTGVSDKRVLCNETLIPRALNHCYRKSSSTTLLGHPVVSTRLLGYSCDDSILQRFVSNTYIITGAVLLTTCPTFRDQLLRALG